MAKDDNGFNSSVNALFSGLDGFVSSKTVLGDPVRVNDAVIIPLMDLRFGIGAGAFGNEKKDNAAGGMGATISPCAVLVIQNGITKVVNVKSQDVASKVMDLVPDLVNRFTKGSGNDPEVDAAVNDIIDRDAKTGEKKRK